MRKVVTDFWAEKDVEEYLKAVEEYSNWTWRGCDRPTKFNSWRTLFKNYQENGGFYIDFSDGFGYGSINEMREVSEKIHFSDAIYEIIRLKKEEERDASYQDDWEKYRTPKEEEGKYAVFVVGKSAPRQLNHTLESAKKEAERLSNKENKDTYIVKLVGVQKPKVVSEFITLSS